MAEDARQEQCHSELALHYEGMRFEFGFASLCRMVLPADGLEGLDVLDVCCRRGKGVYKLSEMVGSNGSVVGIDWNRSFVEDARAGQGAALRKSGLAESNMGFVVGFPEDLIGAGLEPDSFDAAYINNVLTLLFDQELALQQISRVLRPNGLLMLETVLSDRARANCVIEEARSLGNSIQAARTREELYSWLESAGFDRPYVVEEYEVEASRGYRADFIADTAWDDSGVRYTAIALRARKRERRR